MPPNRNTNPLRASQRLPQRARPVPCSTNRTLMRQASPRPEPPPAHPFLIPTMSINNPTAPTTTRKALAQRETAYKPSPRRGQRPFRRHLTFARQAAAATDRRPQVRRQQRPRPLLPCRGRGHGGCAASPPRRTSVIERSTMSYGIAPSLKISASPIRSSCPARRRMAFATVSGPPSITMSCATISVEAHRVQHRRLPAPEIVALGQLAAARELRVAVP